MPTGLDLLRLGQMGANAGRMLNIPGAGPSGDVLGLLSALQGGVRGLPSAIGSAANLAAAAGVMPSIPGLSLLTGLVGSAAGGGDAAMRGAITAMTNPGTYTAMMQGAAALGSTTAASAASAAAASAAAGASAGWVSLPTAMATAAMTIDGLIKANNEKIAMERNVHRTGEAGGIFKALDDAMSSGNLNQEIKPGVRAGDLLSSLASAASRGDLVAGKDIYEEGVMPSGRYETLAQRLKAAGYGDKGLAYAGPSSGAGKGSVDNLSELIGAMDDEAKADTNRTGTAYDTFGKWLDQLSQGLPEAFGPDEAVRRSALWRDTPTGGAALLGARRNELLKARGQDLLPGDEGFGGFSVAVPTEKEVLSSYINDPEKISVTPLKLRPQLTQAAQAFGLQAPDFEQMMIARDQKLGINGFERAPTDNGGA